MESIGFDQVKSQQEQDSGGPTPLTPALGQQKQEDFLTLRNSRTARAAQKPCLENKQTKTERVLPRSYFNSVNLAATRKR